MNRKYLWEDEFAITTDVTEVDMRENSVYPLQGTIGEGEAFTEEIKGMRLFYLMNFDQPVALVGCSEILLGEFNVSKDGDDIILSVEMKGEEPLANPVTGIYIASADFPKSLIQG